MSTAQRTPVIHTRTVPIVVSGATFSVTIRSNDGDWEGFDIDDIQPVSGQTYDPQGYTREDVEDAINEECIKYLAEIVASGFNEDDRGW